MIGCKPCEKVKRGTLGVARSVLGVRVLSQGAIKQRLEVCRGCVESVACNHNPKKVCRCLACGCWLSHKTRLRDEECPKGKW